MKAGKEYELFIFEKFKKFFVNFDVKINDKVIGNQSKIKRELDITVRGKIDKSEIFYVVQCKDHNKPADVKILGEFSSVIKDVGATKGFLICTSGFTKTIHNYANALGIELVTIEDVNSEKWNTDVSIPVIFIKKDLKVNHSFEIKITDELKEKNKNDLELTSEDIKFVSTNNGNHEFTIIDYISNVLESKGIQIIETTNYTTDDKNLMLKMFNLWVPVTIEFAFIVENHYFLKYIKPDQYSQISDHKTKSIMPLEIGFFTNSINFDEEELIEINNEDRPVLINAIIELEESLFPLKNLTFESKGFTIPEIIKNE